MSLRNSSYNMAAPLSTCTVEEQRSDYRRVTIDEIAVEFNMSHGSACKFSVMTSGIGKCVTDGSQGSFPMITSVHGRRFFRNIWTVILVKKMLFSIEM